MIRIKVELSTEHTEQRVIKGLRAGSSWRGEATISCSKSSFILSVTSTSSDIVIRTSQREIYSRDAGALSSHRRAGLADRQA